MEGSVKRQELISKHKVINKDPKLKALGDKKKSALETRLVLYIPFSLFSLNKCMNMQKGERKPS